MDPVTEQKEIVHRVGRLFVLADRIEARFESARTQIEKLTPSLLAKAFRGEIVPTEADLAEAEGREFESAEELLARVRSDHETKLRAEKAGSKAVKKTGGKLVASRKIGNASTESSTALF